MSPVDRLPFPEDRQALLRYARQVAEQALGGSAGLNPSPPKLEGRFGGAFVTLWNRKRLRGCVGTFAATTDLADTIARVTRDALADSRFAAHPVTPQELPAIAIEISILSDLERTGSPAELTPGRHGIVIRRGAQSGCFLPKVASERGWGAEEFLSQCCTMKAGLPPDAWRDAETEVFLFTADAFTEGAAL